MTFKIDDIRHLKARFNPKLVDKSLRSALSKTTNKTKTEISKITRKRYAIKAGVLSNKKTVRIKKSSKGYIINYVGRRLSISPYGEKNFGAKKLYVAKGHKTVKKKTTGRIYDTVSVKVMKNKRRSRVQGRHKFGAFTVMWKKGGHKPTVFERMTKERLPLKYVSALAVPQMVQNEVVEHEVVAFVNKEMPRQFDSAMNFHLKRAAGLL